MTIRRILYALVFYGGSIVYVLFGTLMAFVNRELLGRITENWSQFQYRCMAVIGGVQVRIEGDLPRGPFLYAIKHESYFETIDMPRLFERPAVIAKAELLRIPLWGVVAHRYGVIGIDRAGGAKELRIMLKRARQMVDAGRPMELAVFDLLGRRLNVLKTGYARNGPQTVVWNGLDDDGTPVGTGVYLLRLRQGSSQTSAKVALVK